MTAVTYMSHTCDETRNVTVETRLQVDETRLREINKIQNKDQTQQSRINKKNEP